MSDFYDDEEDLRGWAIWAVRRASRYGLGDAAAWLKEDGKVMIFATEEAASAKADELNRTMPSSCSYSVKSY